MPLTFLHPALWLGALAAGVPLVLHLLQRRRPREIPFSDLRFLEEVQSRRARALGLRRWLLLLLRMLAILLIVAAVAGPRFGALDATGEGAASLLTVLDASASMGTAQTDGTRFATAVGEIAQLLSGLPSGTQVQVLLAGPRPRALFTGWTAAGPAAASALRAVAATEGAGDLPAALEEAAVWAGRAPRRPVTLLVVSDLQASDWDPAALAAAAPALGKAGFGSVLLRQVGVAIQDGGVTAVRPPLRALQAGEATQVVADVRVGHPGQVWRLELDGRRLAESLALEPDGGPVPPGGVASVTFALTAPSAGRHRGLVTTDADRFAADDARPFLLTVRDRIDVLVIHGVDHGAAGRGGRRYWEGALRATPGDSTAAGAAGGLFQVRSLASDRVEDGDLDAADVVLLIDPDPLGRRVQDALSAFLRAGGGVGLIVGDRALSSYLGNSLMPALGLPTPLGFRALSESGAQEAKVLRPDHPVFAGLPAEAIETLERARWRRYFALPDTGLDVLMAAADGTPLLAEKKRASGRLAVLPFHLVPDATDLAHNPMFLPFARRLTATLAAGDPESETIPVGDAPSVALGGEERARGLTGEPTLLYRARPGAAPAPLPARLAWRGDTPVLTGETARRQGFYAFVADGDTLGEVVAAVPARECDPALLAPSTAVARLRGAGLPTPTVLTDEAAAGVLGRLAGVDLAPWLLLLAVAILLAETALSRRAD